MERRVRGNSHARCGVGENPEIASKDYLSLLTEAYLSFTNYGDVADSYYEVRVNITDVFQNMI